MPIIMTREIAFSASWAEGNRNMRKGGRKEWNEEDWNAAAKKFEELWPEEKDWESVQK